MSYATTYDRARTFYDADSHIMELPGFLTDFADPQDMAKIPAISFAGGGRLAEALAKLEGQRTQPPERRAELLALGDALISGPKGYAALGAFDGGERAEALDRLGFHRQLVFSTFSAALAFREAHPLDV
ncbi:MAG TPA: hypothetical protein VKU41_13150, partial [Polyangiaceae bacterium]|nr:hypothetical protein [Polyangiaceae bacterium]